MIIESFQFVYAVIAFLNSLIPDSFASSIQLFISLRSSSCVGAPTTYLYNCSFKKYADDRSADIFNITKTCCFTGHRFIDPNEVETVFENTKEVVSLLASKGVKFFGTGGALGFDTIAAQSVLAIKDVYPEIKLILVLPCENQTKYWKQKDIDIYNGILEKADKVKYLSKSYYDGCMQKRNRHLVDCSSYCVCYLKKQTGGTAYTVEYAKSKNVKIINVVEG